MIILPAESIIILFAINSISETICVAIITILFILICAIKFRILILSFGSNPAVGSSKIKMSGSLINAWAINILCFIPPENPPNFFFLTFSKLTNSSISVTLSEISFLFMPFKFAI